MKVRIVTKILNIEESDLFTIIPQSQFKTVPWKNGKGETIELAISNGGTLDRFDWRLSIASVIENGLFSNFSGYYRNLVLISGNGITLAHREAGSDRLDSLLCIARFDGGNQTTGLLKNGPITDFNIIVEKTKYRSTVKTFTNESRVNLSDQHLSFCYGLSQDLLINDSKNKIVLNQGDLLRIDAAEQNNKQLSKIDIIGKNFILINLEQIMTSKDKR